MSPRGSIAPAVVPLACSTRIWPAWPRTPRQNRERRERRFRVTWCSSLRAVIGVWTVLSVSAANADGPVVQWGSPYVVTPPSSVDGTGGTASAIAAGEAHACAIQSGSGAVVCWGSTRFGAAVTPPDSVNGIAGTASAVAATVDSSCAIQAGTGAVICWGEAGQTPPPNSVNGTTGTASAIAMGADRQCIDKCSLSVNTCAIQAETGAVVCWGARYPPPTR